MTDDQQMTGVVRPVGKRDIDEARRDDSFVAGRRDDSDGLVRVEREIHKPLAVRREACALRLPLQHSRLSAEGRHFIHVPSRVGRRAEDHARVVMRKRRLSALAHARSELHGGPAHLLQPHLRRRAILSRIGYVDDHPAVR